jgi:hypothetical protein
VTDHPESDVCPGPPEQPYTSRDWVHRWAAVAVAGAVVASGNASIQVIEVCPSCLQWRPITYRRWDPTPETTG